MAKLRVNLPDEEKRRWIFFIVLGFAAASLIVGLLLFSERGWGSLQSFVAPRVDPAAVGKLRDDSLALENQFRGRTFVKAPTEQDLQPLAEAIRLHREWMAATRSSDPAEFLRLQAMEVLLAERRAESYQARSREAEALARERLAAGEVEAATRLLQEAYEAQRRVNASRADRLRDAARETTLARELENLSAIPVRRASDAAEAAAWAAVKSERWSEALEQFKQARDLQLRVNRDFPRSRASDFARLETLEIEIASYSTGGLILEIEQLVARAEGAATAGRGHEAATLYREALTRQLKINTDFPKSRFASRQKVEEWRIRIETMDSLETADALRSREAEVRTALVARQVEVARQTVDRAKSTLDEFQARFRRSTLVGEELRLRISYLHEVQGSFAAVQDEVFRRLADLPGGNGRQMLSIEVSQGLYQRVMFANPSRNAGADFPVESVSWDEATQFAQRLGWILGREVRLPTLEEFRSAVGTYDASTLIDGNAWIAENSGNRTQAVGSSALNRQGFHDLLGNVAEWLQDSDTVNATVAGGSFSDRTGAFLQTPVSNRAKSERSRTVGFRIVLPAPPAAP